jgi:lipopolysaccharide transport system ATP-binding protein
MSDTVIRVENLGKKYVIGHQQEGAYRYRALRDVLADGARALSRQLRAPGKRVTPSNQEEFWALKDVSFEVKRGEVVGIIGRNGAGKSTLLKILSRITEPTTGRVRLKGRVASLLEVGTGFHPELTGRENIFLNGAILGMSKAEISRKFDEIVEFAEIARFLDTPVKRYSSGMYVRLAFAVAAHLEPEILVVDEVLAVGDAAFQKKCLGKMGSVAQEGRTILFVSHDMGAIKTLCSRTILLEQGQKSREGIPEDIITSYLSQSISSNGNSSEWYTENTRLTSEQSSNTITFKDLKLSNLSNPGLPICTGETLLVSFCYSTTKRVISPGFVISVSDFFGQEVLRLSNMPISGFSITEVSGNGLVKLLLRDIPLVAGEYYLDVGFVRERTEWIAKLEKVIRFQIHPKDVYRSGFLMDRSRGLIVVNHSWFHEQQR